MALYKWMPVIYTRRLLKPWQAAANFVWFTVIRPDKRTDIGLHAHEHTHFKQALRFLFVGHALLYRFSKTYRMACEVDAYAEQLKHSADKANDLNRFARFIASRYDLNCTIDQARDALKYRSK